MKGRIIKLDARRLWEDTYADDPVLPHGGTALYKTALQIRNRDYRCPEDLAYYRYMLGEEHSRYRVRTPRQARAYAEDFVRIVQSVALRGYEAGRGTIKVRKRGKRYVISDGHRRLNAVLAYGRQRTVKAEVI